MNTRQISYKYIWLAVILICLIVEVISLQHPFFQQYPYLLQNVILIDLSLVIPIALYLFLRHYHTVKLGVLYAMIGVGVLIGSMVTGTKLWLVVIALELIAVLLAAVKSYGFIHRIIVLKREGHSLRKSLRLSLRYTLQTLNRQPFFRFARLDVFVWRYSIFSFFLKSHSKATHTFSYHHLENKSMKWAIAIVVLFEAIPQHLLIHSWNIWVAWLLTFANVYLLMWLWADSVAMRLHPIELYKDHLVIVCGFRAKAIIYLDNIRSIKRVAGPIVETSEAVVLSLRQDSQLMIELHTPVDVERIFRTTKASRVYFNLEDEEKLLKMLEVRG
jgi:hypothetical protein